MAITYTNINLSVPFSELSLKERLFMTDQRNAVNLFETLVAILKATPQGLTEYQLLLELANHKVPGFLDRPAHDTLNLFRRHFLLFHSLYRLRDAFLEQEQLWLEIHCLEIVLRPIKPSEDEGRMVQKADRLREYYLDMKNFQETDRDDVERMIHGFWKRYEHENHRDAAFEVLGLEVGAPSTVIKKRYRELARTHHPDFGGEAEAFRRIAHAADVLLS